MCHFGRVGWLVGLWQGRTRRGRGEWGTRRSPGPVVVVTLIWVGVSPGGGLTGVMMGLANSRVGFETWVWWLVGDSIVSVGVGLICGPMESMALAFWCESVRGRGFVVHW